MISTIILTRLQEPNQEPCGSESPEALGSELIPYAIALKLEMGGCDWSKTMGWLKYLFSDGIDGHKAQQDKKAYIENCEAKINELAEGTRKLMSVKHPNMKHLANPRRVVVTNIAADAGIYELALFFDVYEV